MRKNILLAVLMAVAFHFNVWAATEIEKHWNCDPYLYPHNMTIVGVVEIDEAEQGNTSLEVGAFCGTECRGSEMLHYFPQVNRFLVFLTVYGEDNDSINFKLYDHGTEEELDAYVEGMTFEINAMHGLPTDPYEFNFIPYYNATVAANPTEAGTVTGGGHYLAHEAVTLSATPNTGWNFVNWTEDGEVMGTETTFQFEIVDDRSLVANFEMIMHHVDVGVNYEVAGSAAGAGDYQEGTTVTVSATANTGFHFDRWTENGETVSTSASYAFAIWEDRNLTAEFKLAITDTTAFSCVEYDWHGQNYTSSGTYYDTLSSYLGIDSIVALHLTIYPAYAYNLYETACDSFLWNDTYYYESGDYEDAHQSIHGCDSIYTLHLTINQTRPLGNFTYMTPANNYINRYTDVDFYWDGVVNADRYDFYFWEDGNDRPTNPTIANSVSVTAHRDGLEHGVTYHWCVVAKNECMEMESMERTFVCQLNPAMSVLPQGTLDFGEVEVGQSSTKNISVSGTALPEDISYTFLQNTNDAEFFTITPSSNWNNLKGGTLHVTFTPVADQLYYSSAIRIASGSFVDTVYFTGSMANRYVFTTNVDGDLFTANDSITITGHVADVLGNVVPDLDVDVYLLVWGMRTTLRTTSDENGNYSVKYGPRSSESGYYQVGSCEKNKYATAVHDAFDIPGMSRTTNNFIIWDIYQDETATGSIPIRNRSRIPLGNIQVVPVSVPAGLEVSFGSFSLGALETGELHYTFTGTEISTNNSYAEAVFQLVSSDGIVLNLTCYYLCRQRRGDLDVYPPSISTTMKRNAQKMLTFQVTNNGNGETGPVSIDLPDVEWMTVMGGDSLASIAVGDSIAFSIRLFPDENVSLTEYTGNFAVNCANGNGFSVPYTIQATSDSTGTLIVDVTDDYTYNTNDGHGPHLSGATVTVTGYYSLETVAQGSTDNDGIFSVDTIPEGYYYLTIIAPSHAEYNNGIIYIEGGKTNTQEIYLQFLAISASWEVVPTEVEDEYGLVLTNEIKTNVPVPVVLVEGPSFFDTLAYGDTLQYSMTVSNRGLVDAYDTHITIEENYDDYVFTPMFDVIDTLHPHDVVIVPCIMTRVNGGRETTSGRNSCNVGFDKSLSWYRCNQQLKCVEHQTQFTIGAPYTCTDYASYHPAPQGYTNNPINNPNPNNSNPVIPPIPNGLQNNSYQSHQNASPEIATTSQDCVPCWRTLNIPMGRTTGSLLYLEPNLQELIRQSRSCAPETNNNGTEWPLWAQTGDLSKIDPELQELMRDSRDGNETFRIIVEMKDQYNNPNLERGTALMTRAERRDYVVNELKRFSESSQAEVSRYLDAQATRGGVRVLHNFWIFNGVCCEATANCIDDLSMRNDVRYVSLDKEMEMDEPIIEEERGDGSNPPEGVQWHVTKVRANEVWNYNGDSGYTGSGIVVAVLDSGVNYDHIAISNNMWEGGESYPNHGWDFGNDDNDPSDVNGHGSHVAGIVAGHDAIYKSGIAPDATIMALKISYNSAGYSRQNATLRAIEFALEHGADIITDSNGSVGVGGNVAYRDAFTNVLTAGIVATVLAGNHGDRLRRYPVPNNIWSPGNCPPPWHNEDQVIEGGASAVICIGNTTQNDVKHYDSSEGPVTWQNVEGYQDYQYDGISNMGLIRPDVSAPGTGIWSLNHNNNNYCKKSGTSMATPCVAGIIALMLEANPNLTPAQIDMILETTAVRCEGQTKKNNQYGAGRVDAYAAVTAALNTNVQQWHHISVAKYPFSACVTVKGYGHYQPNEQCTLQAFPAEHFLHWKKNGENDAISPEDPNYTFTIINDTVNMTFTVTEDAQYIAYFDESMVCHYVDIFAKPEEGASGGSGWGYYYDGQSCTVTVIPNQGYMFYGWYDGDRLVSLLSEYTFSVYKDINLTALFKPITYGPGEVLPPPTLQDLSSNANLLNSYSDAISNCTSGNNRDSNEGENLISQLDQCYNFYQAILNIYTNLFQEEEWMEEENIAQFLDDFNAFVDPIDQSVSPQATQQLIDLTELTSSNASTVQSFVERWNRSVQYWNEGIYTLADLPEGYDPNFVQKDGSMLQPAEAACEYATDNGFNNFADMYYTTLSDCNDLVVEHQTDVCAKVSVQFKQTMAMTREAFEGTLKILNGHTTEAMENIDVNLVIKNHLGQDVTDLFQINITSMDQITGVDGSGSLNAQTEGIVQFMMIPTIAAAPEEPAIYSFGGSFTFLDPFSGEEMTYQLYPVELTVNPSPNLYIDYFVQRNIISDDPLTEDTIEPMEEAEIAMMIRNLGAGDAKNVYLESSQPEIIDNQNNLLIEFNMTGSAMNGERRPLGLTDIPFGTIAGHTNGIAEWYFTSSLIGRVINSTARVIHNNSYGNPQLSLVSAVNTHELIKAVSAYGALDDGINDFLVNEISDFGHIPDKLYFSNGDTTNVIQADSLRALDSVTHLNHTVVMQMYPHAAGWNYGTVEDPGGGRYELVSCTRNDGQEIPLNNVWITHITIPHDDVPIHENILHIVDTLSTGDMATYTLVYDVELYCDVTVTVNPEEGGTATGGGHYDLGESITLEAIPNEGYSFVSWTEVDTIVSTEPTFNIMALTDRDFVANFSLNTYQITATTNSSEWGTVTGGGTYSHGSTCTLTATPTEGYVFIKWTKDGEVVSTEPTYSFTVTEGGDYVGYFGWFVEQPFSFKQGWNWWSTYIDMSGDLLTQLEDSLGTDGVIIKSRYAYVTNDEGTWFGGLNHLDNQYMYMILTENPLDFSLSGALVNLSEVNVNLSSGWNWMGNPLSEPMPLEEAIANLDPDDGDIIKSFWAFSSYDDEEGEWFGNLITMVPGIGYMYYAERSHSFYYIQNRNHTDGEPPVEYHWIANPHAYAENMSIIAVVHLDGEELNSGDYEIAAYADGKCLGSTRLKFNNRRQRHFALIPVSGEKDMQVTFRLYDVAKRMEYHVEAEETFGFVENDVLGSLNNPVVLHFNTGIQESTAQLHLYPNPTKMGQEVCLSLPEGNSASRVEIYNVLNMLVSAQTFTGNTFRLSEAVLPGTYVIKVFVDNTVYYGKLIVN